MLPRSTSRWLCSMGFTLVLFTACLCTTVRVLRADEPKAKPPITPSTVRARLAEMQLQATMNELVKVRVEKRRAHAEVEALRARLRLERQNAIPLAEIEGWVRKDNEVNYLKAHVQEIALDLRNLQSVVAAGKDSPKFQATTKKLEDAQLKLKERTRKLKPIAEEELRSAHIKEIEKEIANRIAERVTPLETLQQDLLTDIERLSKELESSQPSSDQSTKTAIRQIRDLQERIRQITKESDEILQKLEAGVPKK